MGALISKNRKSTSSSNPSTSTSSSFVSPTYEEHPTIQTSPSSPGSPMIHPDAGSIKPDPLAHVKKKHLDKKRISLDPNSAVIDNPSEDPEEIEKRKQKNEHKGTLPDIYDPNRTITGIKYLDNLPEIQWKPDFNLGVEEIDSQHQKLVILLNKLNQEVRRQLENHLPDMAAIGVSVVKVNIHDYS